MRVDVLKLRFICVPIVIYAMFDCPRTVTSFVIYKYLSSFQGDMELFHFPFMCLRKTLAVKSLS